MTITHTTYDDLATALIEDGWQPGPPASLAAHHLADDLEIYRNLECDACGQTGAHVRPWHCGRQYRLLLTCVRCSHSVEA